MRLARQAAEGGSEGHCGRSGKFGPKKRETGGARNGAAGGI